MGWRKQSISISGVRSEIKQLTVALQLKYSEYHGQENYFSKGPLEGYGHIVIRRGKASKECFGCVFTGFWPHVGTILRQSHNYRP